jgi:hypothetical protein
VSTQPWSAYDDGYLRAYQWAGALAAGSPLPQEAATIPLNPGEVAHARFAPVALSGYFGEAQEYHRSFLLVGGPVGLALTGAASYARNKQKQAQAAAAAVPRWHQLGPADVVMTNQRLVVNGQGRGGAFWYAEMGPLQLVPGPRGAAGVQLQPSGQPLLRIESVYAPLLYVFVHHLVDGRAPGVPMPAGLLERAAAEGRLR